MKVTELAPGEVAPEDADRIILVQLPNGVCGVSGVVRTREERSVDVAMVSNNLYPTLEEARAAGIAWAEHHGVTHLLIETPDA